MKRTSLRPGKPPERRIVLKPGQSNLSRSRLAAESPRRRGERKARTEVRRVTRERAGDCCEAIALVPEVRCWHPAGALLHTHEIPSRGRYPGSQLHAECTVLRCAGHHQWVHTQPREAEARGLLLHSGAVLPWMRRPIACEEDR